jgi:hypothetical protein
MAAGVDDDAMACPAAAACSAACHRRLRREGVDEWYVGWAFLRRPPNAGIIDFSNRWVGGLRKWASVI